ncbi:hypothetical protein Q1W73_11160 [Asticcacaulis sp. ZE23SCel15]|uniref:hypothetical protein n=1 Tax=Asticcacaulis sp. ZE23SCel15 TaxID=3059027 RepID=UPI00265FFE14|nr:hypothetical protein [Asticcacaulis sp. ZE23SCel15]WKL56248.1 hypothetical protein Q1W73_11160 [Asticcacaulis sp. ZE23SCel15]
MHFIAIAFLGYVFVSSVWWFYRGIRDGETIFMRPRVTFPFRKHFPEPATIKKDSNEGLGFYIVMVMHVFVIIVVGGVGMMALCSVLTP